MSQQLPLISEERPTYTTQSDETERAAYVDRLREKLADPAFRAIEGFPIGDDEAILALSDPPYYTACPNPFLPEIVAQWQEERKDTRAALGLSGPPLLLGEGLGEGSNGYTRDPFAADVSEGKNDPIYNAHSYHTKVPHKAIMRYILHYTDPGDIVFDGFCGTGMTGVAAQLCGDKRAVESLGYRVDATGVVYDGQTPISRLGQRKAVLVDLSPAATFIAYNYNTPVDVATFETEAKRILAKVEEECGWMHETWHPHYDHPHRVKGRINYTVWSDVFVCPNCAGEMIFWEVAVDKEVGEVLDRFVCSSCGVEQRKTTLDRAWETSYDRALGKQVRRSRQVPVLINYSVDKRRYEKTPDVHDLTLVRQIEERAIPYWFPTDPMMFKGEKWGDTWRAGVHAGITHTHHFYTLRSLATFSVLWKASSSLSLRCALLGGYTVGLKTARFLPLRWVNKDTGPMKPHTAGTLYIPSLSGEQNWLNIADSRIRAVSRQLRAMVQARPGNIAFECRSSSTLNLMSNTADYVFIDPPFGGNLMYSELSFIAEAWLRLFTANEPEAIVNQIQRKGLGEYQRIMERCCHEFYRVLKPGRWMTVEFHNSQNAVWNAIQEAILRAGFMVADVRTLDKQQGTFKQVTTTSAVKQDLIISAYKPTVAFERRFQAQAGSETGAWDFVEEHLRHLPQPHLKDGRLEVLAERQSYLLFDRMVAFHIQRGMTVPMGAAELYAGLRKRYSERDGMYFLPLQASEYDRLRLEAAEIEQLPLIVADERSAILWLRRELGEQPLTYQDLMPRFLRELHQAGYELLPELRDILEENFLQDEADRWYVPDPGHSQDLEKLRERALLREFREYVAGRGRLKVFRSEAVRAGFRDAWRRRDYATIVAVAQRLPERAVQEDADLLMYYDNALMRSEAA